MKHPPFTHGEIAFSAVQAPADNADMIGVAPDSALFATEHLTWYGFVSVTKVKLLFKPGYQLRISI